jgi:hypothetical protein
MAERVAGAQGFVENKDLAATAHGRCLENKLGRFGNSREVALHVGVHNGDRPSRRDLFLLEDGTTLPLLPSTLPKRTETKRVPLFCKLRNKISFSALFLRKNAERSHPLAVSMETLSKIGPKFGICLLALSCYAWAQAPGPPHYNFW